MSEYDYEQSRNPDPLADFLTEYEALAESIVANHDNALQDSLSEYNYHAPASATLTDFLRHNDKLRSAINTANSITRDNIVLLGCEYDMATVDISEHDRQLQESAQEIIKKIGRIWHQPHESDDVASSELQELLKSASSPVAAAAIRTGLDRTIWNRIEDQADLGHLSGESCIDNLLREASSPSVVAAMRAGLDSAVWSRTVHKAGSISMEIGRQRSSARAPRVYPRGSMPIKASSLVAEAAMRAGLDRTIWHALAQREATGDGLYSNDSHESWKLLDGVSSPDLRTLFGRFILKNSAPEQIQGGRPNFGRYMFPEEQDNISAEE